MANIDPKKIPKTFIRTETILKADYNKLYEQGALKDTWYIEKPTINNTIEREVIQEIDKSKWDQMQLTSDKDYFKEMPIKIEDKQTGDKYTTIIKGEIEFVEISGKGRLFKPKIKKRIKDGIKKQWR